MENRNSNTKKWFTLAVLILGGGTVFKLPWLKDAFYVPMMDYFHLTHTQIGFTLTVYAFIQTFGYIISMYVADRFSKKKLMPTSLIGIGLTGFYLTTFPSYYEILVIWGLFALFAEIAFWPVLIKSVRLLGDSDEQGRMFGYLEAGRGIVDTVIAFAALGIFKWLGEGATGLKGAIIFFSITMIVIAVILYFLLEDDEVKALDEQGNKINKNKVAFEGAIKAIKMPEIWVVAFTIFSVYSVYIGLTYFIPFLKDIYGIPVALVGVYGIINQYGLKMLGGPIGGYLADKKFKSPSKYLRVAFAASIIGMIIFILLPHQTLNVYVGVTFTLAYGAIIFTQRAVFFAPIEEVGIPREISGAAVSIACLVGYAPSMFAFILYGSMLDRSPGMEGYRHVFLTMIAFAVIGFIISSYLVKIVNKKKENQQNLETKELNN
ncbi:MFS transporter [Bacillus sp. ISL-4]|uniref:MFS transporter n=1 Tax=Bacillus sp. ISL-4 TaxID=2819125 RepID=UPI001BE8DE1D|nr:MFS transporter [Bacillus sp. ISL-4]MBT2666684.1 MFS transporter [Bacillus sp. ISL-4]MBT2672475.1 MFS transporter [Streptomyces sp. ISL-14]